MRVACRRGSGRRATRTLHSMSRSVSSRRREIALGIRSPVTGCMRTTGTFPKYGDARSSPYFTQSATTIGTPWRLASMTSRRLGASGRAREPPPMRGHFALRALSHYSWARSARFSSSARRRQSGMCLSRISWNRSPWPLSVKCAISWTTMYSTQRTGFLASSELSQIRPAAELQLPHLVFILRMRQSFTLTPRRHSLRRAISDTRFRRAGGTGDRAAPHGHRDSLRAELASRANRCASESEQA